jgi:hypothetical protein
MRRKFSAAWLSFVVESGSLELILLEAWPKATKSWVRFPKSRLIRGYEGRVSRRIQGRKFQAHLSSTRGGCSNEADHIQNEFKAGGEARDGGGEETL